MYWRNKHIIYLQYTNPGGYPPLEHSSQILAEEGWQILFLGCEAQGSKDLLFSSHEDIFVRKIGFMPAGWRQKLHYIWFMVWAIAWTVRWRPHWLYASDPLSCPAALVLSYLPNIHVIYHEHDSPSPIEVEHASGFMRLVFAARRRLAHRSAMCVLPNQERTQIFKQSLGLPDKILTVWNCPSTKEVQEFAHIDTINTLRLYYHGSLGEARLPFTVLEAIALNKGKIELQIVGYETLGAKGYINKLLQYATQLGIQDKIHVSPALPRHELWKIAESNHIGIAFMPTNSEDINFQYMVGASNKPFDYLACGLTLLVSDLPAWHSIYVEPGYGLACEPNDPRSISAALCWFMEHPIERLDMGARGRQKILSEWNYEKQFAPILTKLNAL